jgi:MFS family permease
MSSAPPRPPLSQVLALLGASLTTAMANLAQTTVLGLLVYDLTRSELDLGLLGLAEFAPALLLVLVAGAAADRFDRRRVTAFGAIANAVVALALAWYVHSPRGLSVTPIFVLVLAFGAGQAFLSPALRSLPAAMVTNEGVPWLVARRSVASQTATIIGPVLGGLLYGAGAWVPLVAAAVLSGAGAALVMAVRVPDRAPGQLSAGELNPVGDDQVDHVLEDGIPVSGRSFYEALEGLRFVRAQPIVLGAISLDLFAVLFGGAVTLLPAIAVRLHVGALGLGWLRAAAGLGAGAMTLVISFRPVRRRVGRVLLGAVAVFGVWTIVLGVTRSYALAFVAMFALSAADAISVFIRSTLVPLATPPEMRGRVLAVENVFIGASNELGGFESGAVGQLLGTTGSVVLGGIATLVVALLWGVLFVPLRRLDRFPTLPPLLAGGDQDAPTEPG